MSEKKKERERDEEDKTKKEEVREEVRGKEEKRKHNFKFGEENVQGNRNPSPPSSNLSYVAEYSSVTLVGDSTNT